MTAFGVLGLDTSHATAFADTLASLETDRSDPSVTAVWDGRTVRDDEFVTDFCSTYGATRYDDPTELVDLVDAAMVLGVDWERHVPLALPFLDAGVPTLIDKPVAGSRADLDRLAGAASSTPLFGGSAVPFHPAFAALPNGSDGRSTHLAGYNDYFYYRVHVVDTARRLAGASWTTVEPVADSETSTVEVRFANGTWMTLRFDGATDEPAFAGLDVADCTRTARVPATAEAMAAMYEPYLERFLALVHGERGPAADLLDAAELALAVEAAFETGAQIDPGHEAIEALDRPSGAFVADYEPYY